MMKMFCNYDATKLIDIRVIDKEKDFIADVLIEDGLIKSVVKKHETPKDKADTGIVLMPGFVDLHVHFREPGFTKKEDLKSGSLAALKGGFTHVVTMGNTMPPCSTVEVIEMINDKVKKLDLMGITQVSTVTKNLAGEELVDIEEMVKHTNLFSDDGCTIFNDDIMRSALIESKVKGFKILAHTQPETEIVKRDIKIQEEVGGNLHICHISKKDTLEEIIRAKKNNQNITCEVTPHHLFKSEIDYKVNPSFRTENDRQYLIEKGLKEGYIDVIATDHAPHTAEDKEGGSPGISLIEVAFGMINKVFHENDIDLNRLSELMSYNPSKFLGLNGGLIEEGLSADLVLIDLDAEEYINTSDFVSRGKNNPFNGEKIRGKILSTIKSGIVKYKCE
jgi:dihydroorotase